MANSLQVNDKFPAFSLQDHNGNTVELNDLLGQPVVIYFYPKDNTRGCTKEACAFRDQHEFFSDAGVDVVGISGDSPESHRNFRDQYNLPFTLLSDRGNRLRKKVGVPGSLFGLIPGRVTYILDENGYVKHIFDSMVNFEGHVKEAMATINALQARQETEQSSH